MAIGLETMLVHSRTDVFAVSFWNDRSWREVAVSTAHWKRPLPPEQRSCPKAWCSWNGVVTASAGLGRVGQAAAAGNPTIGSSLSGAIVSSVM